MASALLTVATASFSVFFSHGFRSKGRGHGQGWFCENVESALSNDVAGDRIVVPSDGAAYNASIEQYASSSLPAGSLHPSAVVYVESVLEAQKVVQYATRCRFTVAVRSGGHQYSGLSSCNSAEGKCLQIDTSLMNSIDIGTSGKVTVGPGVNLEVLYASLAAEGMFVGAGECSGVNIGGHAQTGGAGVYTRSFGFLADNVEEFEIVLAGGGVKRVTRPAWRANPASTNDMLFWAVLGGNAGSWGVVTSYTLHARNDRDYPHSTYYSCVAEWSADAYLAAAGVLNEMVSSADWPMTSAADESTFITIAKREPVDFNTIHVEGVWSGVSGNPFDDTYFRKFAERLQNTTRVMCSTTLSPPSHILRDNVTLYAPREFPFPYMKTARGVKSAIDSDALSIFANSIDSMMADPANGVYPVQQLATFGGAANSPHNNNHRTALPNRDFNIILGLNAFYGEAVNPTAKETATNFLSTAWAGLMQTATFKNSDYRITWSPFDDLRIETTWQFFWDAATFFRLRSVKTLVDPTDVFRTKFTIPPFTRRYAKSKRGGGC